MRNIRVSASQLALAALVTGLLGDVAHGQDSRNQDCFSCTLVIGYSQVGGPQGGWFVVPGGFLSRVDPSRWQLLWNSGAGVDRWRDPEYGGWNTQVVSPCAQNALTPQRVLLSISGPYGSQEHLWAEAIEETIVNIRSKYPSVEVIIPQAVVGGPGGQSCLSPSGGGLVRASWQHNHIVNAIEVVASRQSRTVIAGFRPQVRTCADYSDGLGHLTPAGAAAAGTAIGLYSISDAPAYANCDRSEAAPALNIDDLTCFINQFAAAQALAQPEQVVHYANCDGSTGAPVLNVDDFMCFINAFASGCP